MLFPDTVTTVAGALQIIDYLLKFGNWLTPHVRNALIRTRAKITVESPTESVEIVSETLISEIERVIANPNTVLVDLSHSAILLEEFISSAHETSNELGLPKFAIAFDSTIRTAENQLAKWNAFDIYGREFYSDEASEYRSVLLRQTLIAKRLTSTMRYRTPIPVRGSVYFERIGPLHIIEGYRKKEMLFNFGRKPLYYWVMDFNDYFDLNLKYYVGKDSFRSKPEKEVNVKLNQKHIELLLSALLDDVQNYAKLIRGEIRQSNNLLYRLFSQLGS